MTPSSPRSVRASLRARGGEPPTVNPSHSSIGTSYDQFSAPPSAALDASSASQSSASAGLANGSATATPFQQVASPRDGADSIPAGIRYGGSDSPRARKSAASSAAAASRVS